MADLDELRKQMKKRKELKSAFASKSQRATTLNEDNNTKDAEYHYHLAKCYDHGLEGYPEDEFKEYQEYQLAANLGHTGAMIELAVDYAEEEDSVLGYDLAKAEDWARKAINMGNPDGYKVLYDVFVAKGKNTEGLYLLETGVEKGSLDCIEERAWMLYWGDNEYGDDIEPAVEEAYELIKDKNWSDEHTIALQLLGYCCRDNGNPRLAKEYFERLLRIDDEDYGTMADLGALLRSEDEVRDYPRALELLKVAAEKGNFSAMNSYGLMLYMGEGIEQDEETAISWFRKAAQEGYATAMINLGDILAENNKDEALYWYKGAMKGGHPEAEQRIQDLTSSAQNVDLTRSSQIIDSFMDKWDEIVELEPYTSVSQSFPNRLKHIQKVIDREGLSVYEVDRLKLFQAMVSLLYFDYHINAGNLTSLRLDSYYAILDHIDELIGGMETVTNEAAFIYYTANLFSADRYQDVAPSAKLKEFWSQLQDIELNEDQTEWKVDFLKEKAESIYNYMRKKIGGDEVGSYRSLHWSDEKIRRKVFEMIVDKLTVDDEEVHLYSRLQEDLGADSLDAVDLIMELEKEFDLTIPDSDAEKIRTVGDIVVYINNHI
ncbi:MAG: acyl carrier protein [Muribaculaceae bacterium]|nr:acyl carrier protein [Muribaculaceae bacterium]